MMAVGSKAVGMFQEQSFRERLLRYIGQELRIAKNERNAVYLDVIVGAKDESDIRYYDGKIEVLEQLQKLLEEGAL